MKIVWTEMIYLNLYEQSKSFSEEIKLQRSNNKM